MIRRLAISFTAPIILIVACIILSELFPNGFVSSIANSTLKAIFTWPINFIEFVGLVDESNEGFYNRWLTVSALTSISILGIFTLLLSNFLSHGRNS